MPHVTGHVSGSKYVIVADLWNNLNNCTQPTFDRGTRGGGCGSISSSGSGSSGSGSGS